MRIESSIKSCYRPKWSKWEGVRECIQNGVDAQTAGHPLSVEYDRKARGTLYIRNVGVVLSREAMLLGHSDDGRGVEKADNPDMRGRHGDGLKVGILALVRAGCTVTIRTGREDWRGFIGHSEYYRCQVFGFDVASSREALDGVEVAICGLTEVEWETFRRRFLFLRPESEMSVRGYQGSVLFDPAEKGQIYCKGIWVTSEQGLHFGFDFEALDLDVDRRVPVAWDLQYRAGALLEAAVRTDAYRERVLDALVAGTDDVAGLHYHVCASPEASRAILARYTSRYGDKLPVATPEAAEEARTVGLDAVVVPRGYADALSRILGDPATRIRAAREAQVSWLLPSDLSIEEQRMLGRIRDLLATVLGDEAPVVLPVVFSETSSMSSAMTSGGVLGCARSALVSPAVAFGATVRALAMAVGSGCSDSDVTGEIIAALVMGTRALLGTSKDWIGQRLRLLADPSDDVLRAWGR